MFLLVGDESVIFIAPVNLGSSATTNEAPLICSCVWTYEEASMDMLDVFFFFFYYLFLCSAKG